MFTFPDSVSRLAFQYPAKKQTTFATQVIQFVGGAEQRYPITGMLRQWQAQPVLLPDQELQILCGFFALVNGTSNPFQFTDPWDGTIYPVCYFKDDLFETTSKDQNRTTVTFTILEGRLQT